MISFPCGSLPFPPRPSPPDDECVKELTQKEGLIVKYESEIHQRMDEIEKKQIYVDRLNRKYDALTSGQEEENLGPLEATIKNLTKDISRKEKESGEMQVRILAFFELLC